jgi:hypothetical protein
MLKPTLDAANGALKQKGKTFNFGMGGMIHCAWLEGGGY